jgi:O-antigen ligase
LTIAAMLCGGLFVKTGKPQNTRMRGMVLLLCAVAVSVSITVIYPQLLNTSLGIKLELISRTVFHKNFFSGRQEIWKNIEELIIRSPYIGYGLAATPSAFYTTDYSCHSLWLQTALQSGIPGILLLLGLYINAIFRSYHQENRTWYLIASFGAAYIIHESFEVSLTQNNFCLGISVWFFLGLAIAFRKNRLLMIKEKKQAGRYYAESE